MFCDQFFLIIEIRVIFKPWNENYCNFLVMFTTEFEIIRSSWRQIYRLLVYSLWSQCNGTVPCTKGGVLMPKEGGSSAATSQPELSRLTTAKQTPDDCQIIIHRRLLHDCLARVWYWPENYFNCLTFARAANMFIWSLQLWIKNIQNIAMYYIFFQIQISKDQNQDK